MRYTVRINRNQKYIFWKRLLVGVYLVIFLLSQLGINFVYANNSGGGSVSFLSSSSSSDFSYLSSGGFNTNSNGSGDSYVASQEEWEEILLLSDSCGSMNFFNNGLNAEDIQLQPVAYEAIPVEQVPIDYASVLGTGTAADAISPVDAGCKGLNAGRNVALCGDGSTEVGFIGGQGDSVHYNENCTIKLVYATMPAYFKGVDKDPKDGRIDTFENCEFPDISNVAGSVLAANYDGQDITPGDALKRMELRFLGPDPERPDQYELNVAQAKDITFNVSAVNAEGGTSEVVGGIPGGDSQHSKTYDCEDYYSEPSQHCETSLAQTAQTEEYNVHTMFKPPAAAQGNWVDISDTCPSNIEKVRYRVLCLDLVGITTGWLVKFTGSVPLSRCTLDQITGIDLVCKRRVNVAVFVKDLFDERMVEHTDFLVAATMAPQPGGSADSITSHADLPDDYVATPGICSVCGQYTLCMIVWRDYRRVHWKRAKAEYGPINCSDPAMLQQYPYCDYEVYKKRVEEAAGGVHPDFVPL